MEKINKSKNENGNKKKRRKSKLKRQVSIITVFLWIFLVATMITVVTQNIKNTNALEHDNVSIYTDINDNVNISEDQIKQGIVKPNKPTINDLPSKNQKGYVYVKCIDNAKHIGNVGIRDSSNGWKFGEVKENDGRFGSDISAEDYPWMCELILDKEFYKELFNKNFLNQYGNHYVEESNNIVSTWFLSDGEKWYFFTQDFPMTVWITHEKVEYTVTYTDGVDGEIIFQNQTYKNLKAGDPTPTFVGGIPTREGYKFVGWSPEIKEVIDPNDCSSGNIIKYTAMWKKKEKGSYKVIREYYIDYIDYEEKVAIVKSHVYDCIDGTIIDGAKIASENLSWQYRKIDGREFKFKYIGDNGNIVIEENIQKDLIIKYKYRALIKEELSNIFGENFVKVHCVNNHTNEDTVYGVLNNSGNITINKLGYSNEKKSNLCNVIIDGEEYARKYSVEKENLAPKHYLVKDNELSKPAIYDEDRQKEITLYYDEEEDKWKVLEGMELPVIFNVSCNLDGAKVEGFYKVNHEYYLRDKDGNMILEGVNDLGTTKISFIFDEIIKVGVSNEEETVDIEIKKKPNYNINDIEYIYEYYENSGNIVIEEDVEKEIVLKYVREEENETKIKVEKVWEDENNKYRKRPENVVLQIKNGEEIVAEMEVSEENNWNCEFVLPKYDKEGNEIEYTVDEKETDVNYEKRIDGYKVINKYIGEEKEDQENKKDKDNIENNEPVVDTSDMNIFVYVLISFIAIIGVIVGIIVVRKNKSNRK